MSKDLEVTTETMVTIKMSGEYVKKLERSLGNLLASTHDLDRALYTELVNTSVIDNVVAFRVALINATE